MASLETRSQRTREEVAADLHDQTVQVLAAALVLLDRDETIAARDAVAMAMEQLTRLSAELSPELAASSHSRSVVG